MAKKAGAASSAKATTKSAGGSKAAAPLKFLIVEGRYYEHIADALLKGATETLTAAGATYDVITVDGALEVPAAILMATEAAAQKRAAYAGAVALGCVIQGETYHFELVSNESARGLMDLTLRNGLCLGNGILTCDTEAQALARSGPDGVGKGNKGADAARAALTMAALKTALAAK